MRFSEARGAGGEGANLRSEVSLWGNDVLYVSDASVQTLSWMGVLPGAPGQKSKLARDDVLLGRREPKGQGDPVLQETGPAAVKPRLCADGVPWASALGPASRLPQVSSGTRAENRAIPASGGPGGPGGQVPQGICREDSEQEWTEERAGVRDTQGTVRLERVAWGWRGGDRAKETDVVDRMESTQEASGVTRILSLWH